MIEEQLYREALLDIYKNPPNRGELLRPDFEAKLLNPLCGDEIKIQVELANSETQKEKRKIGKAVFSGNGCAISQASASLLAEFIEGKKLSEIQEIGSDDILKLLGITPTPARMGCALLSLDTLRKALKDAIIERS